MNEYDRILLVAKAELSLLHHRTCQRIARIEVSQAKRDALNAWLARAQQNVAMYSGGGSFPQSMLKDIFG